MAQYDHPDQTHCLRVEAVNKKLSETYQTERKISILGKILLQSQLNLRHASTSLVCYENHRYLAKDQKERRLDQLFLGVRVLNNEKGI